MKDRRVADQQVKWREGGAAEPVAAQTRPICPCLRVCPCLRAHILKSYFVTMSRVGSIFGGRTKCQPDKMPTGQNANLGWHFVRDFFSMVGILSGPTFWLAFCPDHLNMSWHPPPNIRVCVGGGPVTSFCLLLTVVGEK